MRQEFTLTMGVGGDLEHEAAQRERTSTAASLPVVPHSVAALSCLKVSHNAVFAVRSEKCLNIWDLILNSTGT